MIANEQHAPIAILLAGVTAVTTISVIAPRPPPLWASRKLDTSSSLSLFSFLGRCPPAKEAGTIYFRTTVLYSSGTVMQRPRCSLAVNKVGGGSGSGGGTGCAFNYFSGVFLRHFSQAFYFLFFARSRPQTTDRKTQVSPTKQKSEQTNQLTETTTKNTKNKNSKK